MNTFSYFRSQIEKLKMEAMSFKHYQTGYCRFQEHCWRHHILEICETKNCKNHIIQDRGFLEDSNERKNCEIIEFSL